MVDHVEACEHNFYDIAARRCTNIQGVQFCPRAFGVREINPEDLHQLNIHHDESRSHLENLYALWSEKNEPE